MARKGGARRVTSDRVASHRGWSAVYPKLNWIFFNSFHFARGRDAGIVNGYLCATATPIRSKFSLFLNWKWEVCARAGKRKRERERGGREREREKVRSSTFVASHHVATSCAIALFHADAYTGEGRDAEINLITSRGVDSSHRSFRLKSE